MGLFGKKYRHRRSDIRGLDEGFFDTLRRHRMKLGKGLAILLISSVSAPPIISEARKIIAPILFGSAAVIASTTDSKANIPKNGELPGLDDKKIIRDSDNIIPLEAFKEMFPNLTARYTQERYVKDPSDTKYRGLLGVQKYSEGEFIALRKLPEIRLKAHETLEHDYRERGRALFIPYVKTSADEVRVSIPFDTNNIPLISGGFVSSSRFNDEIDSLDKFQGLCRKIALLEGTPDRFEEGSNIIDITLKKSEVNLADSLLKTAMFENRFSLRTDSLLFPVLRASGFFRSSVLNVASTDSSNPLYINNEIDLTRYEVVSKKPMYFVPVVDNFMRCYKR